MLLKPHDPLSTRATVHTSSFKDGAIPNPNAPSNDGAWKLWASNLIHGTFSNAGVAVNPRTALSVATVYASVSLISRTISTLPLTVYKHLPNGGKQPAPEHELYDLLHNSPNELMTSTEWRFANQFHYCLRNGSYSIVHRTVGGGIDSIVPVRPEDVEDSEIQDGQLFYRIRGEWYNYDEVLHMKNFTTDGITHQDLVSSVSNVIGLAIALEQNAASFFKNNSKPSGFLSHPESLGDKAYGRLKNEMNNEHQGVENSYKMMVLEEGLKYEASRSENKDSQFDESRGRQDKAIARVFGVPPHKLGLIENMPRANVEQENLSFVIDTIRPICVNQEQVLNKKLLSKRDRKVYFIEHNLDGLLRGDLKTRYAAYAQARQWGWMNVDEVRSKENMNPLPDDKGQIYLEPTNMIPAGEPRDNNDSNEPIED
jgi:HK97 family phage portal protein